MVTKLSEILHIISENLEILRKDFNVLKIGVFGSYSRNEQDGKSDLDVLVEFDHSTPVGIVKYIRCEEFLEKILNLKVDLVTPAALKPLIKSSILRDVVYV